MPDPGIAEPTQLCQIQYNGKYRCIGFETLCPSVGRILYEYGLPALRPVKLSVSIKRTQPAPERGARQQGGGARPAHRPKREEKPRVWQPKPAAPQGEMSFEDMMARYKSRSEEKIADLKRVTENHRGGYSRRRG